MFSDLNWTSFVFIENIPEISGSQNFSSSQS